MRDIPTKEFFQNYRQRRAHISITKLEDPIGEVHTSQSALENIYFNFYSDLLTSRLQSERFSEAQRASLSDACTKLSPHMEEILQEEITLEELTVVVNRLAPNRSLGPNGIAVEFYKKLWPTIGEEYLAMIKEALVLGPFHGGVMEGLIALLYKRGGPSSLNIWRPITLLNVSYKI